MTLFLALYASPIQALGGSIEENTDAVINNMTGSRKVLVRGDFRGTYHGLTGGDLRGKRSRWLEMDGDLIGERYQWFQREILER